MTWDNPEPGVYEARATRTVPVVLEVFEPNAEDAPGRYAWWALRDGRVVGEGEAVGLAEAQRQCVKASRMTHDEEVASGFHECASDCVTA